MTAPFASLAAHLRHAPARVEDAPGSGLEQRTTLEPPPRRTALERRPVEAVAAIAFLSAVVLIAAAAHCSPPLHRSRLATVDPSGSRQSPSVTRDQAVLPLLLADLDVLEVRAIHAEVQRAYWRGFSRDLRRTPRIGR